MARCTKLMKDAGPYKVQSCSDGSLKVYPDWPQFPKYNDEDGGGPGMLSRLGLAHDLEQFLNAPYKSVDIADS